MHVRKSWFPLKVHFFPPSKICNSTSCFVLDWESEAELSSLFSFCHQSGAKQTEHTKESGPDSNFSVFSLIVLGTFQ